MTTEQRPRRIYSLGAAAVLLMASVEPSRLGFQSGGDVDSLRWLFLAPLYLVAAIWVATDRQLVRQIRGPFGFLIGAATTTLLFSAWGDSPTGDVVLAFGGLALALLAGSLARQLGVSRLLDIFGVVTFALGLLSLLDGTLASNGRIAGLYPAANALGIHGAVLILDGVRRWLRKPTTSLGQHQVTLLAGPAWIALGLVILIQSDSRTSMAAALVSVVVLLRPHLPRLFLLALVPVLTAIVAGALTTDVAGELARQVSRSGELEEITTVTGRTEIWDVTIDLIASRPLTGYGTNGGALKYQQIFDDGGIGFNPNESHNLILQAAINGGVITALLLMAAVASYMRRSRVHPDPTRSALVALIFVHGLTESMIREPKDLWIMLAAAFAATVTPGPSRAEPNLATESETDPSDLVLIGPYSDLVPEKAQ